MSALPEASHDLTPRLARPFFDIPPFPGRRHPGFERLPQSNDRPVSLVDCVASVRDKRVGGTFWAAQPELPATYLLLRSAAALPVSDDLIKRYGETLLWLQASTPASSNWPMVVGECDPWHMLSRATALICDADDEVRIVATILGVPVYLADPAGGSPRRCDNDRDKLLADALPLKARFANPFNGEVMNLVDVIDLCGFWRSLIDSNRAIGSGVGFAFWKRESVLPLLWGGGDCSDFFRGQTVSPDSAVAIWRSKAPAAVVEQIERRGTLIVEVEDGFLRSNGLGADCVPPLSITVDRLGPYFDPAQPSELENLIEHGQFAPQLVARAGQLRATIVAAGLGKYDRDGGVIERFDSTKRHILVAGQVEDDRSILTGGAGLASNLELLKRVREREPEAFLIYKPHPDVVAGHRKGDIPGHLSRQIADKVVSDVSISSLIAMVDEVHVNTSLAGFEALMRLKQVTTYGVPFYAGWGLTRDLGPVPARRTRTRSLDELIAATLLVYPRYLDPVSGLPCPAEIVVDRLCAGASPETGMLVAVRRLQGRVRRFLKGIVQ